MMKHSETAQREGERDYELQGEKIGNLVTVVLVQVACIAQLYHAVGRTKPARVPAYYGCGTA